MKRVEMELSDKMVELIDGLVGRAEVVNRAEVIRRAASIYSLLLEERDAGRDVVVLDRRTGTQELVVL